MIIWQGWGLLAAFLPVLFYIITVLVVTAIAGEPYVSVHSWPGALGVLISAGAVWWLVKVLGQPDRQLLDLQTGETVVFRKKHSLFFIPLQYFVFVLVAIAVWMLVAHHDSRL
jgi:hypothetical protein